VVADWMCSSISDTITEVWSQEYEWFPSTGLKSGTVGYTLSYYIGTAPATGMMAAVSSFPIWAMWRYGPVSKMQKPTQSLLGVSAQNVYRFQWWSLVAFQICYYVFLGASGWNFGIVHLLSVGFFITLAAAHYISIAIASMQREKTRYTKQARIVFGLMVLSILSIVLGFVSYQFPILDGYGFFFGEAIGLSCIFAVTPALVLFGEQNAINDIELVWTVAGIEWARKTSILGPDVLSQAVGGSEAGHPVSTAQLLSIADMQLNMNAFDSVIKELVRCEYAIQAESIHSEPKGFNEDGGP